MRKHLITIASLAVAFMLPLTAQAQGRHDEKPHGYKKPAATSAEKSKTAAATGGRHDAGGTTHGKSKAAPKKDKPAASDATNDASPAK